MEAIPPPSPSVIPSASTTSVVRRTGCRSRGWPRRRPPSRKPRMETPCDPLSVGLPIALYGAHHACGSSPNLDTTLQAYVLPLEGGGRRWGWTTDACSHPPPSPSPARREGSLLVIFA